MDTSNSLKIVGQLRGTNKIPLADIPVEAWLEIIDGLYRQPLVAEVPKLFTTIAEIMERPVVQNFNLKRGQTAFDREIGINTSVCVFQLQLEPKVQMKALLLLLPDLLSPPGYKKPLKWAVWCIKPAPRPSVDKFQSYVYWADKKEVHEIFSQYPDVGCEAIARVQCMTREYAGSLRKTADAAEGMSSRASDMYWRIKHGSID